MTDLAQGQAGSSARPGGRATARAVLGDALAGVELTAADQRFLSRLSQWDKRSAMIVASLVARARQAGQREARAGAVMLGPQQLEIVLAALMDAFAYRTSDPAPAGCWDYGSGASGSSCEVHAGDCDHARAFAELAALLSEKVRPAGLSRLDPLPARPHQAAVAS
jgi:hypothetical protein